jgi:hypothetical protein
MEIIEQIGSYAGFAAILGLAILAALYFSQARDVKRLREAEEARAPKPTPAPVPGPQRPGAARPAPAAAPAPAKPATGGAGAGQTPGTKPAPGAPGERPPAPAPAPGQAGPAPAPAPAAGQARPAPAPSPGAPPAPKAPPPAQPPGPGAPAPATASAAQSQPTAVAPKDNGQGAPKEGAQPPAEQTGPAADVTRDRPPVPVGADQKAGGTAAPARPQRPPARPGPARGLPPLPAAAQRKPPWYRRLAPRYIVLLVAGALVLATGAAFGIAAIAGGGDEAAPDSAAQPDAGASAGAPLDPSTIEVAVLNGTSVSGAAESVAGTVEQAGFQIGNVANATEQTSAESAVLFADGARRAAREVGRELSISQLEPLDPETQSLAGTADVAVIVGADQAG